MSFNLIGWLVVTLAAAPGGGGPAKAPPAQTLTGKVLPLATVLKQRGVLLDEDAASSMVLLTGDGNIYTLVKDDGTRMFYLDKRLHDRPMRLTGQVLAGSQLLQVERVQSLVGGKPHDVYYWCDNCLLRYNEPCLCFCCGGPTELREVPAK